MHYLFFDIEAANSFVYYSICQVGVIVCDENLNILERRNFYIKPDYEFNIQRFKQIAVTPDMVKKSPSFGDVYAELKRLFDGALAFGHAVYCDVLMFVGACNRYRLPMFNFDYLDTQEVFKKENPEAPKNSLEAAAAQYNIEFNAHDALSDAEATLMLLKAMLAPGVTLGEVAKHYGLTARHIDDQTATKIINDKIAARARKANAKKRREEQEAQKAQEKSNTE